MSVALWTASAMRDAMQAEARGALPASITGISIDSRTIAKGDAYFAIKGDVHDGHTFVEAAIRNDPSITERQKQTLLDVYRSFRDQQADPSGDARTG